MKKYIFTLLLLLIVPILIGCNNKSIITKSEYKLNEEAMIDDIYITLNSASYNDNELELVFNILNKTNNTITINPNNNFKFYDINRLLTNNYENNKNVIKKGQTISYTLKYTVDKKELYDIYFYSGIVENNIKFVVTSNDLK